MSVSTNTRKHCKPALSDHHIHSHPPGMKIRAELQRTSRLYFHGKMKQMIFLALIFCLLNGYGNALQAKRSSSDTWIEPTTHMKFLFIPSGCFTMGSPSDEAGRDSDEGPLHKVCVRGFWMGCYEVTVEQFKIFINETGYKTDAEREGYSWIYSGTWQKKAGFDWKNPGFQQSETSPVVNVSWKDATRMAEWLTSKNGKKFRLPTEAEWEYACRAGTKTARFWGNDPDRACEYANVADVSAKRKFPAWHIHQCNDGYVFTAPVGSFKPNAFGLFDMLGNVWEWCEDNYLVKAYADFPSDNPLIRRKGVTDLVIRGGSWYSRPRYVRSASRDHLHDSHRRGNDVGFRLVVVK